MSFSYNKKIHGICLKLTGESLMGEETPLYFDSIKYVVEQVKKIKNAGIRLCIVVGGGNIYRGIQGADSGIAQKNSDYMGMLATVINCLGLADVLCENNIDTSIFAAFPIGSIVPGYNLKKAKQAMDNGNVVLFCAGTGHPYFTTDTASVLRGLEMDVDLVLKATKVDGIYTEDPVQNPQAKKIEVISYAEVIAQRYNVMDITAFSLCQNHGMPIIIYDFFNPNNLDLILNGKITGTLVTTEDEADLVRKGV